MTKITCTKNVNEQPGFHLKLGAWTGCTGRVSVLDLAAFLETPVDLLIKYHARGIDEGEKENCDTVKKIGSHGADDPRVHDYNHNCSTNCSNIYVLLCYSRNLIVTCKVSVPIVLVLVNTHTLKEKYFRLKFYNFCVFQILKV